jgi:hypothetical protein
MTTGVLALRIRATPVPTATAITSGTATCPKGIFEVGNYVVRVPDHKHVGEAVPLQVLLRPSGSGDYENFSIKCSAAEKSGAAGVHKVSAAGNSGATEGAEVHREARRLPPPGMLAGTGKKIFPFDFQISTDGCGYPPNLQAVPEVPDAFWWEKHVAAGSAAEVLHNGRGDFLVPPVGPKYCGAPACCTEEPCLASSSFALGRPSELPIAVRAGGRSFDQVYDVIISQDTYEQWSLKFRLPGGRCGVTKITIPLPEESDLDSLPEQGQVFLDHIKGSIVPKEPGQPGVTPEDTAGLPRGRRGISPPPTVRDQATIESQCKTWAKGLEDRLGGRYPDWFIVVTKVREVSEKKDTLCSPEFLAAANLDDHGIWNNLGLVDLFSLEIIDDPIVMPDNRVYSKTGVLRSFRHRQVFKEPEWTAPETRIVITPICEEGVRKLKASPVLREIVQVMRAMNSAYRNSTSYTFPSEAWHESSMQLIPGDPNGSRGAIAWDNKFRQNNPGQGLTTKNGNVQWKNGDILAPPPQ